MAIFANEWPTDFTPGSDFVQIDDEEFILASEPSGLIAIAIENRDGYLTREAAKRLWAALTRAIENSEAERPDAYIFANTDEPFDDGMPF
jgi:hypothetical protein